MIVDALSYLLDGRADLAVLVGLVNYLSFFLMDLVILFITTDLCARIASVEKSFNRRYRNTVFLLCAADVVFLSVGTLTGKLFTVENGVYTIGPWNGFCTVLPSVCFLANLAIVIRKAGVLGKEQARVMMIYFIMPGLAAILLIINGDWAFSYVGLALGMALFFVLVQSKAITETNLRAKMYNELSTTDLLTGLKNRRGYEALLFEIGADEAVCAVFCDLNSLKEVNDNLGHEAGDRLIQGFADLLRETFPDDSVFRISGDEFVVIIRDVEAEPLQAQMQAFGEILRKKDRIASYGYESGAGNHVLNIVKIAEQKMYRDKDVYYLETGKQRRHARPTASAQSDASGSAESTSLPPSGC